MKSASSKLSTRLLRGIPLICVLLYAGVLRKLESADESLRTWFLIGMVLVSFIALVILVARKEVRSYNLYILAGCLVASLLLYFFSQA